MRPSNARSCMCVPTPVLPAGSLEAVRCLLAQRPRPVAEALSHREETPLHLAAVGGHYEVPRPRPLLLPAACPPHDASYLTLLPTSRCYLTMLATSPCYLPHTAPYLTMLPTSRSQCYLPHDAPFLMITDAPHLMLTMLPTS